VISDWKAKTPHAVCYSSTAFVPSFRDGFFRAKNISNKHVSTRDGKLIVLRHVLEFPFPRSSVCQTLQTEILLLLAITFLMTTSLKYLELKNVDSLASTVVFAAFEALI
jgi:hypothetical protein